MDSNDEHTNPSKNIITAVLITLGSEAAIALLLFCGLLIAKESPAEHVRWFAAMFIPPILILRNYAKKEDRTTLELKAIIITLFLSVVAFFAIFKKFIF